MAPPYHGDGTFLEANVEPPQGQRTRTLHIAVPVDTGSLGLSLQWTPLAVVSNIWHVLDVPGGSPADTAGLLPYGDYILGTPEGVLHGESGLSELVEDNIGRPLRLYVYNNEYNVTREVTIQPSRDWGGEGALGCVLGLRRAAPPAAAAERARVRARRDHVRRRVGEDGRLRGGGGGSTSASTCNGRPACRGASGRCRRVLGPRADGRRRGGGPVAGAPHRGKKKDRHAHSPNRLMDDYFKEEEKKSKELDNAPSGRHTPVAPPPKAGARRRGRREQIRPRGLVTTTM